MYVYHNRFPDLTSKIALLLSERELACVEKYQKCAKIIGNFTLSIKYDVFYQ